MIHLSSDGGNSYPPIFGELQTTQGGTPETAPTHRGADSGKGGCTLVGRPPRVRKNALAIGQNRDTRIRKRIKHGQGGNINTTIFGNRNAHSFIKGNTAKDITPPPNLRSCGCFHPLLSGYGNFHCQ